MAAADSLRRAASVTAKARKAEAAKADQPQAASDTVGDTCSSMSQISLILHGVPTNPIIKRTNIREWWLAGALVKVASGPCGLGCH